MHSAAVMLVISYCTFGVCISAYVRIYVCIDARACVCDVYDCACVRVVCVSVHVLCVLCVHDMFVHTQGIYMCMSHVQLGILQYIHTVYTMYVM